MARIRNQISPHVAETIYKSMIQPLLLANESEVMSSVVMRNKLQSIQNRAHKIVYGEMANHNQWPNISDICSERITYDVHKILHNNAPEIYDEFFTMFDHQINTRGNGQKLKLPKVRSENGRKMFAFVGAKIYNSLSTDLTSEKDYKVFRSKVKNFLRV